MITPSSTKTIRGDDGTARGNYPEENYNLVPSAVTDADGRVVDSTFSLKETFMSGSKFDSIKTRANTIIVVGWFRSEDQGQKEVTIYDDYDIHVRMGVITQIREEL